jgi:hypothetical protein
MSKSSSLGSSAMEEDEDDFYGNAPGEKKRPQPVATRESDDEDEMDESDEASDSVFVSYETLSLSKSFRISKSSRNEKMARTPNRKKELRLVSGTDALEHYPQEQQQQVAQTSLQPLH